jgi:hypothetical protein
MAVNQGSTVATMREVQPRILLKTIWQLKKLPISTNTNVWKVKTSILRSIHQFGKLKTIVPGNTRKMAPRSTNSSF